MLKLLIICLAKLVTAKQKQVFGTLTAVFVSGSPILTYLTSHATQENRRGDQAHHKGF